LILKDYFNFSASRFQTVKYSDRYCEIIENLAKILLWA